MKKVEEKTLTLEAQKRWSKNAICDHNDTNRLRKFFCRGGLSRIGSWVGDYVRYPVYIAQMFVANFFCRKRV